MRLGIYGGSFNPPHLGHMRLAEYSSEKLGLDRLLVIPTAVPPHKSGLELADGADRINMCSLAFENAVVSDIELRREGKSYTVDTVREIRAQYPGDELFLIVGSDMLMSFNKWYKYEEILDMCTLCAADREGEGTVLQSGDIPCFFNGKNLTVLPLPAFEVSSTQVRQLIRENKSTQGLLDPAVRAYIDERGLYR